MLTCDIDNEVGRILDDVQVGINQLAVCYSAHRLNGNVDNEELRYVILSVPDSYAGNPGAGLQIAWRAFISTLPGGHLVYIRGCKGEEVPSLQTPIRTESRLPVFRNIPGRALIR